MSEFQHYEWQTIDRPLTAQQRAAVNELSSHIDVTSTNAVVTYSWGDFKHDPKQVLARFFDAFLYFANWGSKRLIFRFPKQLLQAEPLQPYLWPDFIELEQHGDNLLLDITLDSEGGDDWYEGEADLSGMTDLRNDILRGDLRALYMAWLVAAEINGAEDDELEPPVPAGLAEPSAALQQFADFFGVNDFLVLAAAEGQPSASVPGELDIAGLISALPRVECDAFLLRLAQGEANLSLLLQQRLQELAGPVAPPTAVRRRAWGELSARAEELAAEENRRRSEAAEAKRIKSLQEFAPKAEQAWRDIDALVEQKTARAYDSAIILLRRLSELATFQGNSASFSRRLNQLREHTANRPAFQQRLAAAKLMGK